MDIERAIEHSYLAWDELARGNPDPGKAIYSHAQDVTLANPFGATVRGWDKVSEMIDYVSNRFSDGEMKNVERIALYESADLATALEIEHWRAKVGDAPEVSPFELRVSTTWRREDGTWKIVHRHADPIRTFDASGPLRKT